MVNLERICKDIARITPDNVDPGGWSINSQPGKDLCRQLQGLSLDNVDPGMC